MQYTHRTILRHFLVALLIMALPFGIRPEDQVWIWYDMHSIFFGFLMGVAVLAGVLADTLVHKEWLKKILRDCLHINADKQGFYGDLLLKWATCSRCVSWWVAWMTGLSISWVYWQPLDIWWQSWIPRLLFAALSASIAAAVAVLSYFLRQYKKRL